MSERDHGGRFDTHIAWLAVVLAFSLPLYRPWVTLASSLIMILWLVGGALRFRAGALRADRLSLSVLLFVALNLLSLIWSDDPRAGIDYLTKYRYLLLVPMIATSLGPAFRRRMVTAFSLAAGFSVILSWSVFSGLVTLRGVSAGNPAPTMSHIDYSVVLALAALLTLNRVLNEELTKGPRLAWAANFALIASGLVINLGRSGQLAFAGGFLALGLHWAGRRSWKTSVAFVAASAVIFTLVWAAAPRLRHRIERARDELQAALVDHRYQSNLGNRVAANLVAAEIVRGRPVLGTGVGGNMAEFRHLLDTEFPDLKPAVYWYPHLHNEYAQVATELGLAGLLSLAWVFWEILRGPYKNREVDGAAIVLATVYLIGFLGDPFLHKQIPLVAFAVFAGLLAQAEKDPSLREGELKVHARAG